MGRLLIRKNRQALRQLRQSFPEKNEKELRRILADMWENLGRYIGEFPHMARFSRGDFLKRTEAVGIEHVQAAEALGKGILFFSGHMGNWELGAKTSWALDFPVSIVYRPLNNPHIDLFTTEHRNQYQVRGLPKGTKGSRELLRTLRDKGRIAILVDQKFSDGIAVDFFGRPALTSPAIAELALRYGTPIVPCRVERQDDKTRFRVTFYAPILPDKDKDTPLTLMTDINATLEAWIRERPEQWFWVHKRWETPEESRRRKGFTD